MANLSEVKEMLAALCEDTSMSKGVRDMLGWIHTELADEKSADISVKIDTALERLEEISADPNLSADVRTWLWRLTSLLEGVQNNK